jgi:hypothetical protein
MKAKTETLSTAARWTGALQENRLEGACLVLQKKMFSSSCARGVDLKGRRSQTWGMVEYAGVGRCSFHSRL